MATTSEPEKPQPRQLSIAWELEHMCTAIDAVHSQLINFRDEGAHETGRERLRLLFLTAWHAGVPLPQEPER